MTDINKEAYKQAEKELLDNKVNEVKGFILETLEKIEKKKKEKEKVEEELRILKLDLEDLKAGKFDKIDERRKKSSLANSICVPIPWFNDPFFGTTYTSTGTSNNLSGTFTSSSVDWPTITSGTYRINTGKIFYF